RGLVGHRAVNDGGAVAAAGNAQSVEPGGPPAVEVALEADVIPPGAAMVAGRCLAHGASLASARLAGSPPPCGRLWVWSEAMSECGEQASPHLVIDVVIQPPEATVRAGGRGVAATGRVPWRDG